MAESPEPIVRKSTWNRFAPLITAVAAPLIVALIIAVVRELIDKEPVHLNIELILDTSMVMGQEFGKTTRFEAAIDELVEIVGLRDADNLALWTSGGSCGPGGTEEVVPFGQNNSDEIRAALAELEPQGPANLGDAIVTATSAFNDPDRFPAEVRKNVIVLTAGKDTCDDDYVGKIESRLGEVGEEVRVKFHFFALKASPKVKEALRTLERELPDQVETAFSETPADLGEDIMAKIAAIDPTPSPTPAPTTPDSPTVGPTPS